MSELKLDEAKQASLAKVKELGKEIEQIAAESLAIQNVGGYHLRNLAIKMNNAMQEILPDGVVGPVTAVPSVDTVIQPNK